MRDRRYSMLVSDSLNGLHRYIATLIVSACVVMPAAGAVQESPAGEEMPNDKIAQEGQATQSEPKEWDVFPTNAQRRDRRNQGTIDEPQLDPMFSRRRRKDDNEDNPDLIGDEEPKVEKLEGFTGILTFLAPEDTELSLGAGPVFKPDYFGSDNYEVNVDPQVYIKINNFTFLDDDGAEFALLGFSGFRFGPSIRLVGDRDESENPALQGLGDVGATFELGGFAATTFVDRYSVKFKVRKGISTGHRGLIVDAFGTALLFRYGRFSSSISAQASWIGNDYADVYFSITPEQSANSGLEQFDARSGFRNIGGSLNGYVNLGSRWSLNPYVSYDLVIGNIQDTPIIRDFGNRDQVRAGFHLIRQFKIF